MSRSHKTSRGGWYILLVLLLVSRPTVSSAQEGPPTERIRLQVGQQHSFCVAARKFYNPSNVLLEAGAHYEFHVAKNDAWYDAKIRCYADGWTARDTRPLARPIVRALEPKRRCPGADWFELIGSIGCDGCEFFRIGCGGAGWTYTPRRDGQLYAFANDLASRYHNNRGSITLTVRRVEAPGKCQLRKCGR